MRRVAKIALNEGPGCGGSSRSNDLSATSYVYICVTVGRIDRSRHGIVARGIEQGTRSANSNGVANRVLVGRPLYARAPIGTAKGHGTKIRVARRIATCNYFNVVRTVVLRLECRNSRCRVSYGYGRRTASRRVKRMRPRPRWRNRLRQRRGRVGTHVRSGYTIDRSQPHGAGRVRPRRAASRACNAVDETALHVDGTRALVPSRWRTDDRTAGYRKLPRAEERVRRVICCVAEV
jgi:hypothetical protein